MIGFLVAFAPAIAVVGTYLLGHQSHAAILLVAVVPLVWLSALVLVGASLRTPGIVALRERAVASVISAVVATMVGLVALNALLGLGMPRDEVGLLFILALAIPSVPSTYWLYLWLTHKF